MGRPDWWGNVGATFKHGSGRCGLSTARKCENPEAGSSSATI